MPKRKPEKPYKGILATPSPEYDGDKERYKKETLVPKLRALMGHYGINPDNNEKVPARTETSLRSRPRFQQPR